MSPCLGLAMEDLLDSSRDRRRQRVVEGGEHAKGGLEAGVVLVRVGMVDLVEVRGSPL